MRLSVTTPRGAILDTDIEEVTAPGVLGEFGILPGHIPFLSAIKPGVLVYRTKEGARVLAVGEGVLEVALGASGQGGKDEQVLVLVDRAQSGREVDREAASKEAAQLEDELAKWQKELGGEYKALLGRRAWAQARVDAAERAGGAH